MMSDIDDLGELQQSAAEAWFSTTAARESETVLPQWLDDLIFKGFGAVYHPGDMRYWYTLDLTEEEVKVYLGTYFPRSYCETFCIAGNLFRNACYKASLGDDFLQNHEINVLDLGCGTGGEIIGLLDAIRTFLSPSVRVNVYAFDGNQFSLGAMKIIADFYKERFRADIDVREQLCRIDSEASLSALEGFVIGTRFDFVLFCKTGIELMSKNVIGNPYECVAEKFSWLLKPSGLMLILDVTLQLNSGVWVPESMSCQLNRFAGSQHDFGTLIPKPCSRHPECGFCCYMKQKFTVSHSEKARDDSKVCYRILCRNSLKNKVVPESVMYETQIFDPEKYYDRTRKDWRDGACQHSEGGKDKDAFNINS